MPLASLADNGLTTNSFLLCVCFMTHLLTVLTVIIHTIGFLTVCVCICVCLLSSASYKLSGADLHLFGASPQRFSFSLSDLSSLPLESVSFLFLAAPYVGSPFAQLGRNYRWWWSSESSEGRQFTRPPPPPPPPRPSLDSPYFCLLYQHVLII